VLSLFARSRSASLGQALPARPPSRARTALLTVGLGLGLASVSALCFQWLANEHFPAQTAETLTLDFAQRVLLVACAVPITLAIVLRLMDTRAPIWLRLAAELLLVPCAYAIGLAIIVVYFRNRGTVEVEDISAMKG